MPRVGGVSGSEHSAAPCMTSTGDLRSPWFLSHLRSEDLKAEPLPAFKGWESVWAALGPLNASAIRM